MLKSPQMVICCSDQFVFRLLDLHGITERSSVFQNSMDVFSVNECVAVFKGVWSHLQKRHTLLYEGLWKVSGHVSYLEAQ